MGEIVAGSFLNSLGYYTYSLLNKLNLASMANYIYMDNGAKVIDHIFIGSLTTAKSQAWIHANKIDCVLNLSGVNYACDVPVFVIDMIDTNVTIDKIKEYVNKFLVGENIIDECIAQEKNILVHCAAGINRSAATIAFYLINHGYTYEQAFKVLSAANSQRSTALLTNISFRYLLCSYDAFKVRV